MEGDGSRGKVGKKNNRKIRINRFLDFVHHPVFRKLGRPRHRWVDNIKMDLSKIGWESVDWIDMAQDRDQWRALVNTVLNLRVP
jgi:hypothetical protein